MAPVPATEDYYMVLGVAQNASLDQIVKSYKQLAKKLHPDRNPKHDATSAFQLLGQAYDTLKDESKRRAYNLIYPSIAKRAQGPGNTQTPRPNPTSSSTSQYYALKDATELAALQKSKRDRGARWRTKENAFDSSIFEQRRAIRRVKDEIEVIDRIFASEAAIEAQKNSWATWLASPFYKRPEESERDKERKDRARQERKIEKDLKERRLEPMAAALKKDEDLLSKAKEEYEAADRDDDRKIAVIRARMWERENRERLERERVEREKREKERREAEEILRKQQAEKRAAEQKQREEAFQRWQKMKKEEDEKREKERREAAERWRKQQAANQAEQKRQEEATRRLQKELEETLRKRRNSANINVGARQTKATGCNHDGWWPKVHGRRACPECNELWTYLLECPGCAMEACPRCQAELRQRRRYTGARTGTRTHYRARSPRPDYYYD